MDLPLEPALAILRRNIDQKRGGLASIEVKPSPNNPVYAGDEVSAMSITTSERGGLDSMRTSIARNQNNSSKTHRTILLNKKAEILVALGINAKRLAETRAEAEEDTLSTPNEESVRLRINSVLFGQLSQVECSLDRLESGDYGTCVSCGEAIAAKRLQAVPWALYCIACQDQFFPRESSAQVSLPKAS